MADIFHTLKFTAKSSTSSFLAEGFALQDRILGMATNKVPQNGWYRFLTFGLILKPEFQWNPLPW
jgi:hypothetical protein